ncbi:hypothetical protein EV401DRAFT_1951077 [Pisolithus croceorrhizus]|nr:hypothetical protein EV401DRAFT_1951077 [Pisolithus croceorrhizus]
MTSKLSAARVVVTTNSSKSWGHCDNVSTGEVEKHFNTFGLHLGHQTSTLVAIFHHHFLTPSIGRDTESIGFVFELVRVVAIHATTRFVLVSSLIVDHFPRCPPTVSSGVFMTESTLHRGLVRVTLTSCLFRRCIDQMCGHYRRPPSELNRRRSSRPREVFAVV